MRSILGLLLELMPFSNRLGQHSKIYGKINDGRMFQNIVPKH